MRDPTGGGAMGATRDDEASSLRTAVAMGAEASCCADSRQSAVVATYRPLRGFATHGEMRLSRSDQVG